ANPTRYTQEELDLHRRRLFAWLTTLAEAGPDARVDRLDVLLPEESAAVRADWAATTVDEPYTGVVERVRAHAAAHPDRIAVQDPDGTATYAELVSHASALSRRLRAAGVRRGSRVAMLCEPGIPFVTGILAVLGAGAAWGPLDLRAPRPRPAALPDHSRPDVPSAGPRRHGQPPAGQGRRPGHDRRRRDRPQRPRHLRHLRLADALPPHHRRTTRRRRPRHRRRPPGTLRPHHHRRRHRPRSGPLPPAR